MNEQELLKQIEGLVCGECPSKYKDINDCNNGLGCEACAAQSIHKLETEYFKQAGYVQITKDEAHHIIHDENCFGCSECKSLDTKMRARLEEVSNG